MDELVPDERMSSGAPPPGLGSLVLWLLLVAVLTAIVAWDCLTHVERRQDARKARIRRCARSHMDV